MPMKRPVARPSQPAHHLRKERPMYAFDAFASQFVNERQDFERRIRSDMSRAAAGRSRFSIRDWIGRGLIRLGSRLAPTPLAEPSGSR